MIPPEHFGQEIVRDLIDQINFQQRLPADEFDDHPRCVFGVEVQIGFFVRIQQHIDKALGDVKTHAVRGLVDLIAVGAAEIAGVRHLKGHDARPGFPARLRKETGKIVLKLFRALSHGPHPPLRPR